MKKIALITGIAGQDGTYLAEQLQPLNYSIVGTVRRLTPEVRHLIDSIDSEIELLETPELSPEVTQEIIRRYEPDELFNLAGQSSVGRSWRETTETLIINGQSVVLWLEAIRRYHPRTKFVQASSSEIFGLGSDHALSETSPMAPINPYGLAKSMAHQVVGKYREWFGLFLCNAIMFNHESPRRSTSFVSRKITMCVARIALGLQEQLPLGNLDVVRDWGFAGDYVGAIWKMLQIQNPEDLVIGSGRAYSLRDFVQTAFEAIGKDWRQHVVQDPELFRPADVVRVQANPAKAKAVLDWRPTVNFRDLVRMMVEHDMQLAAMESRDSSFSGEEPAHAAKISPTREGKAQ
ncbi:MAG: GDP-mannose 4,6-dehydratase [Planctomycetaceae bacterium]|nr:GDP-mannose 4,6-dehydratase [Planctomycetaceae bacterium]